MRVGGIFCCCPPSPFYPPVLCHSSGKNFHPLENYLSLTPGVPYSRPGTWILNEWGPTVTDSCLVLTCQQQQQLLGDRLKATLAPLLKVNCSAIPWFCELLQCPSHEPFFSLKIGLSPFLLLKKPNRKSIF